MRGTYPRGLLSRCYSGPQIFSFNSDKSIMFQSETSEIVFVLQAPVPWLCLFKLNRQVHLRHAQTRMPVMTGKQGCQSAVGSQDARADDSPTVNQQSCGEGRHELEPVQLCRAGGGAGQIRSARHGRERCLRRKRPGAPRGPELS